MKSVLIYAPHGAPPIWLNAAVRLSGVKELGCVHDGTALVRELQRAPGAMLVCCLQRPEPAFFDLIKTVGDTTPVPVVAFVTDVGAQKAAQAVAAGVHGYCTDAAVPDLAAVLNIAVARFEHEQTQQQALKQAALQLEDRKVVERAKVILMRARDMSDDDAFRVLRTASMHSNQRLGQVGQHIIESARMAQGVNRAGQLRMLSQRLVKLYLLNLLQVMAPGAAPGPLLDDSIARVQGNLSLLEKSFSEPALSDGVQRVAALWQRLHHALRRPARWADMAAMDALAELLLQAADTLTAQLEAAGALTPLRVLNLAGRQRMLSQRYAKLALLAVGAAPAADALRERSHHAMAAVRTEFEAAQRYLNNVALSSPEIRAALASSKLGWQQTLAGAADAANPAGRERLAVASESLLDVFERLTSGYESSLQMLVG